MTEIAASLNVEPEIWAVAECRGSSVEEIVAVSPYLGTKYPVGEQRRADCLSKNVSLHEVGVG
jgi:hypothetical protein